MNLTTILSLILLCGVTIAEYPGLIFVTEKSIQSINLTQPDVIFKIVDDAHGGAIEMLYEDQLICWSNVHYENIQCKSKTENQRIIQENIQISPNGLACDWYTRKLYWINNKKRLIGVTSIDDGYSKVLYWKRIPEVWSIAVSPKHKYLFWVNWNGKSKIEKASMDGDKLSRRIIASQGLISPVSLTIDYENELIYFSEPNYIASIDFNGGSMRKVKNRIMPSLISYVDNTLFWVNAQVQHIEGGAITGSKIIRDIYSQQAVFDIKVWDPRVQQFQDNPCRHSNGNCSHLCLLSSTSSSGYTCACPTGIALLNNYTCASHYTNLLLISQTTKVAKVSLDTADHTKLIIPVNGVQSVLDIDYDPVENKIYWMDDKLNIIRRANLDGSDQQDIVTSRIASLDSLAIDWLGRNLYWIDFKNKRIEITRLDGQRRKVIISSTSEHLRSLTIAPTLGVMFWIDGDKFNPIIEKADMDGSNRIALVKNHLKEPNSLTIDVQSRHLFWSDLTTGMIEMVDLDGLNRKVILKRNSAIAYSIGFLKNHIYWFNERKQTIQKTRIKSDNKQTSVVTKTGNLRRFKIVSPGMISKGNNCSTANGGCEHFCLSQPNNSFKCVCEIGYDLGEDKKSCILSDTYFVYSTQNTFGKISFNQHEETIPTTSIQDVKNFDLDVTNRSIYYIEKLENKTIINRVHMDGSRTEIILQFGLISPSDLAFDWLSNNLYWIDLGNNKIEVVKLPEGKHVKVILWKDLKVPRCLTLDPTRGVMYWMESRSNTTIFTSNLDGTNKHALITNTGYANDMILDLETNILYWSNKQSIGMYNIMTNKRSTLISGNVLPNSLAIYKDKLFWLDKSNNTIEQVDKLTGSQRQIFVWANSSITKLLLVHPYLQNGWNPCKSDNANCSQLCFGCPMTNHKNVTSTCNCESHFTLDNDNYTCIHPQQFLIYSQSDCIGRIVPSSKDNPDVILYKQDLSIARGIEFDPVKSHMLYINGQHSITRSFNGKMLDNIINDSSNYPFDLALDVVGRMLYWSCALNDTINAYQLDTSISIGVIMKSKHEKPRYLAIHSEKRLLFWIDFGNPFEIKVIQSKVDGNGRLVVAKNLDAPTAFTIDTTSDLVLWAHSDKIESSDLYGGHRKILVYVEPYNILSLAVCQDYVYWFNKDKSIIERVEKSSGSIRSSVFLSKNITDIITVKIPSVKVLEAHVCSPFNSYNNCSHFCIGTHELICACPLLLNLGKDARTCEPLPDCGPDHFTCLVSKTSSRECIPAQWQCDKHRDCSDGSDELGCRFCADHEFKCTSGECIDKQFVCDGTQHCNDALDEKNCCAKGDFRCTSTDVCVKPAQLCDDWEHCADGSDEKPPVCPKSTSTNVSYTQTFAVEQYVMYAAIFLMISAIFMCIICSPGEVSFSVCTLNLKKFKRRLLFWRKWPMNSQSNEITQHDNADNEINVIMMNKISTARRHDHNSDNDVLPHNANVPTHSTVDSVAKIPSNPAPSLASSSSTIERNIRRRESYIRRQKFLNQPTPATPYNTAESDGYNTESQYYKSDPDLRKVLYSNSSFNETLSSVDTHSNNLELAVGYIAPNPSPSEFR